MVTTAATSASEFGGLSGSNSQADVRPSHSAVQSPRAQLPSEDSYQIGGDILAARARAELMPKLIMSTLRTGRKLPQTSISVPVVPEVPFQTKKETLHETDTIAESETRDNIS